MARRVVITGLGLITPLGVGTKFVWKRIINGESGITSTFGKGYQQIPSRVAGFIPRGNGVGMFDEDAVVSKSQKRNIAQHTLLGIAAAELALRESGYSKDVLEKLSDEERERMGVCLGVGMSDLDGIAETWLAFENEGYRKVSPYFVPKMLTNLVAGNISIRFGLQGPNHSVSTACSTGSHSVGDAFRMIRNGDADLMLAGGTDAQVTPLAMAAFARAKALSTKFNDTPEMASRPFDRERDGFVIAEGAAVLILEEYERAKQRGVDIYGEMLGYGMSGDASHITAPSEDGRGAFNAMTAALRDAQQSLENVCYINAHATSTPLGDAVENRAIVRLFGSNNGLAVSSTKGATGHLLGAAGSLEAAITALSLHTRELPPTINLHNLDPAADFPLNYVPNEAQQLASERMPVALSNSFGFGGTNACLCMRAM
ncbi:3-oxoacyl-[acyl-carrier-protein] synthase, mitochondrial-like isoform X1 [Corticium candelabrum]|uniref:3-oxoacyl-[acyl-carrier-protein] synthase, mitochondrial-like isoform X1 n=2 Tax=Corticium candelabrum TaxID=121492 RepID=UPI002E26D5C4|nr:3-oxoacyl-[acyl-carrier-protein] synthase, mitochondrial-like isoform X1 [Corticium candelabrum]